MRRTRWGRERPSTPRRGRWSQAEIARLKDLFGLKDERAIARELNRPVESVRQTQEESFVSTARFTDQDRFWRERFEPGEDGLLGVGQALCWRRVREVEVELGNIDAEVRLHR